MMKKKEVQLRKGKNRKWKKNSRFWDLKYLAVEFEGPVRRSKVLRDKRTWPINYDWWDYKYTYYINAKDRPHVWRPNFPKIFPWRDLNFYSKDPNNWFRKKKEDEREDQSFLETHYHTYYYKGLVLPLIDFLHYRLELIIWHINYWFFVEGSIYFMYSEVCSKNKKVFGYLVEIIKIFFLSNFFDDLFLDEIMYFDFINFVCYKLLH